MAHARTPRRGASLDSLRRRAQHPFAARAGATWVAAMLPWFAAAMRAQGLADLPEPRRGRALLFSSTDPSGGNEDHTHCLRRLADGTCVLAEAEGPGRVVRIWSANPGGDLRIEIDGAVAFAGPFAALFDGSQPPFTAPLATTFAGGALCHVPIPFRQSLRITASPIDGRYHQITVLQQPEREAFAIPPGAALADELAALARAFATPASGAADGTTAAEVLTLTGVPLVGSTRLCELPGAGEVLGLGARLAGGDPRRVVVQVRCDGEPDPCLEAPLDLLLPQDLPTAATGVDAGLPTLRLPQPFRRGWSLRIVHVDGTPADGPASAASTAPPRLDLRLCWRPLPADHDRRTLHGTVQQTVNAHGAPARLATATGSGHLVGVVAELQGAPAQHLSFLEGDEAIVADGRPWCGTGTEDFFSGAWYFRGAPAGHPFAAVAAIDEARARVRCARFLLVDPVPFERTLQVDLEHGGDDDTPGSVYRTLALWYADGSQGRPERAAVPPPRPAPQWRDLRAAALWPALSPGGGAVVWTAAEAPDPIRAALGSAPTGGGPASAIPIGGGQAPASSAGPEHATFWLGAQRVDPVARPLRFDRVRLVPVLPALRAWRVVGPFPCEQRRGLDTVPLPAAAELDGGTPASADAAGFVDLWRLYPRDGAVAFAIAEFELAAAGEGTLVLGSDDAVRAFVDGEVVHEHRGLRGVGRDQDRVPLRLGAGRHRLVLQVENYRGGFGCCARLEGFALR